ncbi:protein of unknown function [Xenorhabdus doucetiae]|uniref:Uncharacterized protein n=1 Tax=Xenorhabdus doucetiae TaxID=351671 RepID=A0A068QPJ0_9GAMM|nr:protein of unknown function [Xenorhabdus doucetiae]
MDKLFMIDTKKNEILEKNSMHNILNMLKIVLFRNNKQVIF